MHFTILMKDCIIKNKYPYDTIQGQKDQFGRTLAMYTLIINNFNID